MKQWINNKKQLMQNEVLSFSGNVRAKNVKSVYYLMTFLSEFSISTISATYVLFLLSQGLDLLQVNLVNLSFMTGNFLFEIPTGAYADFFGRRKSVIISNIFIVITFTVYFFATSLLWFILAETFAALAYTFESGAKDAWLVDSLEESDSQENIGEIFSHASMLGQLASLFGGLVGAYIGTVSLRLPMGVGGILSLAVLWVAYAFMHEKRVSINKSASFSAGFSHVVTIAKTGIHFGVKHKVIFYLVLSSIVSMIAFQPLNMYWSPRLSSLAGNQVWLLGWVWAGMCLFMMFGGYLVKRLLKNNRDYRFLMISTTLFLAVPILAAAVSNIFFIVLSGFLTYEIGRGMYKPAKQSYLNKYIPSDNRATVLSFESMMGKLGAAIGLVVLGWVGKNYSIQTAWLVAGILLLLSLPLYLRAAHHEKNLEN